MVCYDAPEWFYSFVLIWIGCYSAFRMLWAIRASIGRRKRCVDNHSSWGNQGKYEEAKRYIDKHSGLIEVVLRR